jgi:thiamine biosynthesis protein ThiI
VHPPGADTVVVRHGEIGTKSDQVRRKMEGRLRNNLGALLADRGLEAPVECESTRLYVRTSPATVEAATAAVTDGFGVVSASPAVSVEPTMDAICDALARTARDRYRGGTFAVRARRAGNEEAHPFTSEEIEETGGAAVWETIEAEGRSPEVDLDDPDRTFFVECRPEEAFVFLEKREGPGGLPVGTQEPLVALVSGGIDSPVAAWEAMRRGCRVYPLYVDLGEYGGADHRARAEATVADLQAYVPHVDLQLHVAPGGDALERIVAETDQMRMLVVRRFMVRVAAAVAEAVGAAGIVTGEAIGQKSSQTSANLRVTSAVTDFPIHRPLVTADKTAITELAREIDTFEEATIPVGCHQIAPDRPATRASLAAVEDAEPEGLARLARRAAAEATAAVPAEPPE